MKTLFLAVGLWVVCTNAGFAQKQKEGGNSSSVGVTLGGNSGSPAEPAYQNSTQTPPPPSVPELQSGGMDAGGFIERPPEPTQAEGAAPGPGIDLRPFMDLATDTVQRPCISTRETCTFTKTVRAGATIWACVVWWAAGKEYRHYIIASNQSKNFPVTTGDQYICGPIDYFKK